MTEPEAPLSDLQNPNFFTTITAEEAADALAAIGEFPDSKVSYWLASRDPGDEPTPDPVDYIFWREDGQLKARKA